MGRPRPSAPPPPDPLAHAVEALSLAIGRHEIRVRIHTSADVVHDLVPVTTGPVVVEDDDTCVLSLGTDDLDWAARYLISLNVDFDVLGPAALTERLAAIGYWLANRYA